MWTTWESGTCHDIPFSISFITNLLLLHVKTHSPDYPNMMRFTEVAARPGGKPTKCNIGLWGTVCLGTLSIRLNCEVSWFPIFLKIISAAASVFITQKNHFPHSFLFEYLRSLMSQPLCLNISFCVSVYNILLFLFTFPNFASSFFQFWASPDLVLMCSRYSPRPT